MPHAEQVVYLAMIIIDLDYQILAELALDADADAGRVRRIKTRVDARRKKLWRNSSVSQRAKGPPEKETGSFADRNACLIGKLLWR